MSVSVATAPWEPLVMQELDGPLDLSDLQATGTTAFGVRSGEVVLGAREIRIDGHLGPALPAATVGPGQLLILPRNEKAGAISFDAPNRPS